MKLLAFVPIITVLPLWMSNVAAWRSFKVVFDNVTVSTDAEWANLDVQIKELNGDATLDIYLTVLKTINNPKVHVYLRLNSMVDPDTDTEEAVEIFNKTMNLCQILTSKKVPPILRLLFSELVKNGTMFTSCPIQKKLYYVHNFRIDEENLPSYLPETDFLAEMHVFSDGKSGKSINYWRIILNGRIDKSKSLDDFKMFTMG